MFNPFKILKDEKSVIAYQTNKHVKSLEQLKRVRIGTVSLNMMRVLYILNIVYIIIVLYCVYKGW